jgi:hypothetical protein
MRIWVVGCGGPRVPEAIVENQNASAAEEPVKAPYRDAWVYEAIPLPGSEDYHVAIVVRRFNVKRNAITRTST